MSIRMKLLAVATVAVLAAPAAALAQDYGHYRGHDGYAQSRGDAWRSHGHRDVRAYGYGYRGAYPARAYGGGYAYGYAPPRYRDGWQGRDRRYEHRAYDHQGYRSW
jgi:hypothetical protein